MFRKWAVGVVLGVMMLGGVFFLFLDEIVERGLVSGLEHVFQARVDVGQFDLDYFPMRVHISDLEIANARSPMRNLFSISKLDARLEMIPLFSGAFIVDLLEIGGVSFDSERTRSGALKRKRYESSQIVNSGASVLDAALPELPEIKVNFDGSEIAKNSKGLSSDIEKLGQVWADLEKTGGLDSEVAALKAEALGVSKKIEELNLSSNDPKALLQLKSLKDDLDDVLERFSDLNSRYEASSAQVLGAFQSVGSGIDGLDGAAYRDYRKAVSGLSLDGSGLPGTSELLFGSRIRDQLEGVLPILQRFLSFYSTVSPSPPRPRFSRYPGVDVHFPSSRALPRVWVKFVQISGEGRRGEKLSGEFRDLCSDAGRIGKPFMGNLSGTGFVYPGVSFNFDFVGDIVKGEREFFHVTGEFDGVPVEQMLLYSESGKEVGLRSGVLRGDLDFDLGFDSLNGQVLLSGRKLVFLDSGFDGPDSGIGGVLSRTLKGLREVQVQTNVSGEWGSPSFGVSSDLDGLLKKTLSSRLDAKVRDHKRQIRSQYGALSRDEQLKLRKSLNGKKAVVDRFLGEDGEALDSVYELIEGERSKIERVIDDQTGGVLKYFR